MDQASKYCPSCAEWKSQAEFSRDKARKDGLRGRCKGCDSANGRSYRQDPDVQTKERERGQLWNKENRAHRRALSKATRDSNPGRQQSYDRKWYANKGRMVKIRWRAANLERSRAIGAKRRALKYTTTIEPIDRQVIIDRDDRTCYLCSRKLTPEQITLDHVQPLSRNGSHTYDNLRVCCRRCNFRKNARLLSELDWVAIALG